jgi:single-strand DNA-binding protein
MNKVILIGRLVRDPDVRYTQEKMAIARFTLAVDRRIKKEGEQTADFISCIAFGKTGEFVEKYLTKGTKVALEGRWQTGSYTNKENVKIYTNDCIVDQLEFAESKKSEDNDGFIPVPDGIEEDLPFN